MAQGGLSAEAREELALQGLEDPVWFLHFYLEEWFPDRVPWVHLGLLAILLERTDFILKHIRDEDLPKLISHFVWKDDPDDPSSPEYPMFRLEEIHGPDNKEPLRYIVLNKKRHTAIIMPRGFSKTTIANAAVIYSICYKLNKFLVYISETDDHAKQQLENVKSELTSNERLIEVFGEFKPSQREGKWTEGFIQTLNGVVVRTRGRGSQVRGMNVNGLRPDKIIIDDCEDEESVRTPEQRTKARHWLYSSVMPALPRRNKKATILMMGTLLHEDALLRTVSRDPKFSTAIFGAVDRDGDALWEEHMSLKDLEIEKRSYARAGELAAFYREFMSTLRAEETQKFRKDFFHYSPLMPKDVPLKAIAIDPSISEKENADYCAFVVGGMRPNGQIHIFEAEGYKALTPRDQINMYFELRQKYRYPCPIQKNGVEAQAFQAALVHLMREEMFRHKDYFEVTPITHYKKKQARIEGILQPRYANGFVSHQRHFSLLETQLLDWPNGKVDLPDATAMMVALLDPYAPIAANDEDDPDFDLENDQYEPLEEEFGRACP